MTQHAARSSIAALALVLLVAGPVPAQDEPPLRVFLRAGVKTHGPGQHDHPRFLADWTMLLRERGAVVDGALEFPTEEQLARADVLVTYAAEGASIHDGERARLEHFLARGGGIVVVHDAVCGDDPQWFKTVVGGAWEHGRSRWYEGEMGLYFADREHPITAGVSNFDLSDEIYWELHMDPGAHVLANSFRTAHEIEPQMWTFEKDDYRAFVSLPGHDHATFALDPYRTLLLRGIAWAGKRDAGLLVTPEETVRLRYPVGGPQPPSAASAGLGIHKDFRVDLVASEPLVVNPISIDWDAHGRMWVVLTPGYPDKERFSGVPAHDSIVILDDRDGDGAMDSRKVYCDGLDLVTSLVFHRDGVIVTQSPDILFLRDTDCDDVADVKETLYTGFGFSDTHAVTSNLRWGLDGWIYGTQGYSGNASEHIVGADGVDHGKIGNGVFRFRPDGSAIEMVVSYGSNTWGLDFTWDGELFYTMANGSHLRHVVLPDDVMRRGRVGDAPSWIDVTDHTKAFPISRHERHPYLQIDFVGGFTGAAGCLIYDGGAWPREYWGNHFVTEPTVNLVHRDVLTPRGSTFTASKPAEAEFLAARDLWFRPVHLRTGPDGAMYVLDFYNQASVHNDTRGPLHGPTNAALRPDRDHTHGRIWRVQHSRSPTVSAELPASTPELLLGCENRWQRMTAQRLLCEADRAAAFDLSTLASAKSRVHGLWILSNRAELSDALLLAGLHDPDAGVRKNAAKIAARQDLRGRDGAEPDWSSVTAALTGLLADSDPRVVIEAAVALGTRPLAAEAVAALVENYADLPDDWARSAFVGTAASEPLATIVSALDSERPDACIGFVRELAAQVGRSRDADRVAGLVSVLGASLNAQPELVETALLSLVETLPADFVPASSPNLQIALKLLLGSGRVDVAIAVLPLASRWDADGSLRGHVARLAARLKETLDDERNDDQTRVKCLATLLGIEAQRGSAIESAGALLEPCVPLDVQDQVIELLGGQPHPAAADVLIAAFGSFSSKLREAGFNQLLRRSEWAARLLDHVETDELRPNDLGPGRVFRLRNHPDPEIAARSMELFDARKGTEAMAVEELIARLAPIVDQPGDLARGAELFEQHCGTCHTFKGAQGRVGPDLTGMGAHPPRELLPFVLDPNRTVDDSFVEYVVRTWDGLSYGGVLVREDDRSVVLRNSEGEVEVAREDIEVFHSTGRSPMPTGLEEIGAEELRDVFTWLRSEYEGFRLVDIAAACTADTQTGLYDPREPRTLEFTRFGVHAVDGIPFEVIDPVRSTSGKNVIVLKGGLGQDWYCKLHQPTRVEVPVGFALKRLHVLGGISAWGFPFTQARRPAARVTWHYADGATEEHVLVDGREFADWIRPHDVPGSRFVQGLLRPESRGQLRRFVLEPGRDEVIEKIVLQSFDDDTAPTFVALTAELEEGAAERQNPVPMSGTLIVGGGSSHDFAAWFGGTDVATLAGAGRPVAYTADTESLAARIVGLDLLYLSNNQPLPASAREAVERFAGAGGGLLLVHAACWYNWSDWPDYNRELVAGGARSHEAYGELEVRPSGDGHPVSEGVPASFRLQDELYRFEPDPRGPPLKVLAIGRSLQTGEEYAVVWTVERERGRTVCITLGHDGAAHEHPAFQRLLRNAAAWVAEEDAR